MRCVAVCDDRESIAKGLAGVEVSHVDCALFVSSRPQRQRFWGCGTLDDLYVNCVDSEGYVAESLFLPANGHREVVSEGEYSIAFESRDPFVGEHVTFSPGRVTVG